MRFTKRGVLLALVVCGLALLALPLSMFPQAVTGAGSSAFSGSGVVTPSTGIGPNVYGNTSSGSSTVAPLTGAQIRGATCTGTLSAGFYCDGSTGTWQAITSVVGSSQLARTFASAASTPSILDSGALFTGGSGTTTMPHWYINQGTAAVTTWSPNGTDFGINAPSGFTGNLIDLRTNGGSTMFSVNYRGDMTVGNYLYLQNSNLILGVAAGLSNGKQWISTATTGGFNATLYTPATSTATCTAGTIAWDASYFYVCKATNTWMRAALSAF